MYKINLYDNKYTVIEDLNNGVFKALRNGEEWRDLIGDGLSLSMIQKIQELEEENYILKNKVHELEFREKYRDIYPVE